MSYPKGLLLRPSKKGSAGKGSARRRGQKGAVLIVSLVVLVAFTIFVMAMINMNGSQFVVIGNQQVKRQLENAAKEAIEISINSQTQFTNALAGSATVQSYAINGYAVSVTIPYCYGARTAPGYSALSTVAPEDTHWEFVALATDPLTGGSATVTQGVKIRMGAGNCGQGL